jgi:hypothetical protein
MQEEQREQAALALTPELEGLALAQDLQGP